MWSESTVINPEAWSEQVENDLCGYTERGRDACVVARELLAKAQGPQRVTIYEDGTATVEPVVMETPEERAAQEQLHADTQVWLAAVKAQERAALEELAGI